jgi:hypothetical protein
LAHPDEPQRALAVAPAPGATGESGAPAIPDSRRAIGIVFASFAVALSALLAAYLLVTIPGAWFSGAAPKEYDAKALAVAVGTGSMDGDALIVAPTNASGTVIITVAVAVSAGDYRGVAWHVSGLPVGSDARLLWHSTYKPGRTFTLPIPTEADRLAPIVASRDPNWIGPLNGVALALRLPAQQSVAVSGVSLDPLTMRSQLAGRFRDWITFEPWSGASINTVVGGADLQELPLPVLLGLAALLAAGIAVALARWRPHWIGARLPLALVLMLFGAWLVLDLRWQWNLVRQVAVTAKTYAGLDWRKKHIAAEDGPLFEFIEKVRTKLPATPARVFMVADAHYFRGRGAYHLYPYNVYFDPWTNTIPSPATMRSGDYVVVYQRRGIQFDPTQGMLRWEGGGSPIAAESLVVAPGAALFRIR